MAMIIMFMLFMFAEVCLMQPLDPLISTKTPIANQEPMIITSSNQTSYPTNKTSTSQLARQDSQNTTNIQELPLLPFKLVDIPERLPEQNLPKTEISIWTAQTRKIVEYHNQGSRTLILVRGLPGSGKSYLSMKLAQAMCPDTHYKAHVFSIDDFFAHEGRFRFVYNQTLINMAYEWNLNRIRDAVERGLSPIIVDAVNERIARMEPYVRLGVSNGYIIEILEPNNPWSRDLYQLKDKNVHTVPLSGLFIVQNDFENVTSGDQLIKLFRLSYAADKIPPVLRNTPPFFANKSIHSNQAQRFG